jgi:predicted ATPase/class 3 adenylate cyclase
MPELPEGTVTFLFTDVQGSTRMWEEAPDTMMEALRQHDHIIEHAAENSTGVPVRPRGEGDSRFVVFPSAVDAVAAAAEIQRQFASIEWATPEPIRVRMALHTGLADLRSGDYYGSTVNRAARLRGIAHGGQTLVSGAVYELVRDVLPPGVSFLDLGRHRLKDLARAEQVYQLEISGVSGSFPPLQSLDVVVNNLPEQLTPFVGRQAELEETQRLLSTSRLVTITAPGGTGKTRLAVQAAAESADSYPHGVFLIELAAVESTDDLVQAVAESVGVPLVMDDEPLRQLLGYLADKRQLLVMDNFEHLYAAGPMVSEMLRAAPDVTVLATSRARLNITGETLLSLHGLDVDWDQDQDPFDVSGVRLFVDCARRVDPGFDLSETDLESLRQILTTLEGTPLGIMLAAAWVETMPLGEIAAEIRKSLDFLETDLSDVPERHRSMRAVFDYSWALLGEDDRRVFAALSVFRGGFTWEAAEHVAGASRRTLAGLVKKSFLTGDRQSGRFFVHQLLRQYAEEELAMDPTEREERARLHATYYSGLAATIYDVMRESDQPRALAIAERDIENLRIAWRHCCTSGRADEARRFLEPLWFLHEARGWYPAAVDLFGAGVGAFSGGDREAGMVVAELARGIQAWFVTLQSRPDEGMALSRAAVVGLRGASDSAAHALALQSLCLSSMYSGAMDELLEAAEEAVTVTAAASDWWPQAVARTWVAYAYLFNGQPEEGMRAAGLARSELRQRGEHWSMTFALTSLAFLAANDGRFDEVIEHYRESAALCRDIGYLRGLQWALNGLGGASSSMSEFADAERHYLDSLQMAYDLGQDREMLGVLLSLARIWAEMGSVERAVQVLTTVSNDPAAAQQLPFQPDPIHVIAAEVRTTLSENLTQDVLDAATSQGNTDTTSAVVRELLGVE